jgi:hypothetical protein
MPDSLQGDNERIAEALRSVLNFLPEEARYYAVRTFANERADAFIPKLELIAKGLGEDVGKMAVKMTTILRYPIERIQHHVIRISREGWGQQYVQSLIHLHPEILNRTNAELDATLNALAILIPKNEDRRFFMNVKSKIFLIPAERIAACARCMKWNDDPEELWQTLSRSPLPDPKPIHTARVTPIATPRVPAQAVPECEELSSTTNRSYAQPEECAPASQSFRVPGSQAPTRTRPKRKKTYEDPETDEIDLIMDWRETIRTILRFTQDDPWDEDTWSILEPEISWIWKTGKTGGYALTSICRWLNLKSFKESTPGTSRAEKMRFMGQLLRSERLRDILRLDQRMLEYRFAVLRRFIGVDFRNDPEVLLKPWESLSPEELRYRVNEIADRGHPPGEHPYIDVLLEPSRASFIKNLDACPLLEHRFTIST